MSLVTPSKVPSIMRHCSESRFRIYFREQKHGAHRKFPKNVYRGLVRGKSLACRLLLGCTLGDSLKGRVDHGIRDVEIRTWCTKLMREAQFRIKSVGIRTRRRCSGLLDYELVATISIRVAVTTRLCRSLCARPPWRVYSSLSSRKYSTGFQRQHDLSAGPLSVALRECSRRTLRGWYSSSETTKRPGAVVD